MSTSIRKSLAWLHAWAGLVAGWALFMMFLAGTASVFKEEITAWMSPELGPGIDAMDALEAAEARLNAVAPDAERWSIRLPSERSPATRITWRARDASVTESEMLDAGSGRVVAARETRGGDLFYRLHYRFEISNPVRRGWWISGAATMFMLVAIMTGVLTHKRIFRDFFTFRPRAATQRTWLDAHLLLAVPLLPFHLMIAYTGLVPIMTTVMPWGMIANYGDERPLLEQLADLDAARRAYSSDRRADPAAQRPPAHVPSPTVALRSIAEQAAQQLGGPVGSISVRNPNDANAVVEVVRRPGGALSNRPARLLFDGSTGDPLPVTTSPSPVAKIQAALYGMHMARFADPMLRWAYFAAGLASSAMIATGLTLWIIKRRRRFTDQTRIPFGHWLVERLNIAAIVGLPIAMAAYFWANRLLPLDVAARAQLEVRTFFLVWLSTLVVAMLRPADRAWAEVLGSAAFAFGAIPLLNALTTDRHLVASVMQGDWLMAGFDSTMAAIGLLFAWCAVKVAGRARASAAEGTAVPSALDSSTWRSHE